MEYNHNNLNFKIWEIIKNLKFGLLRNLWMQTLHLCLPCKSHRQLMVIKKEKTTVLVLLWCINTKHSERPINPSKVLFISAAVEIFEVTYV